MMFVVFTDKKERTGDGAGGGGRRLVSGLKRGDSGRKLLRNDLLFDDGREFKSLDMSVEKSRVQFFAVDVLRTELQI